MTDTTTAPNRRILMIAAAVVVIAAGTAVWFFFGGDDPAEVDAGAALEQADAAAADEDEGDATDDGATDQDATDDATDDDTAMDDGETDTGDEAGDDGLVVDGTWTVDTDVVEYSREDGTGTYVGFRIDEELSSIGSTTAVGRTPAVTGELTLDGTTVTGATFSGDASALETNDGRRDNRARGALGDGLVSFVLGDPIELGSAPEPGGTLTVDAAGEMTINGVTQPITVPLSASLSDTGVLVVTSSFDVSLGDYDVEAPSAPIVLSVADIATVEVQLFLTPA